MVNGTRSPGHKTNTPATGYKGEKTGNIHSQIKESKKPWGRLDIIKKSHKEVQETGHNI